MSKFHSTVSRRDFMKTLGLAGAGIGTAVAVAPAIRDLDELMASDKANVDRPWWVKEQDYLDSTTEIDWSLMERYSEGNTLRGSRKNEYIGSYIDRDEQERRSGLKSQMEKEWLQAGRPGYNVRDKALGSSAASAGASNSFLGPHGGPYTAEQLGAPKWSGTPEENSRMVRSALRLFGAMSVGYNLLETGTTRKLIYSSERNFKPVNTFKDVPLATETDTERVIPNNCQWVITECNQESQELWKRNPTNMCIQVRYERVSQIQVRLQNFINRLGYQCLGAGHNTFGVAGAFADLAGLGEHGRHNRVITPEYGPTVGIFRWGTDLPLVPGNPIDAGMMKFCESCGLCSEACIEGAISDAKEPYWEVKGDWNSPGHKCWYEDSRKCRAGKMLPEACKAGRCMAACVFTKYEKAGIHDAVKAMVSTTSIFNGFFTGMDQFMGYGLRGRKHDHFELGKSEVDAAQEEWWNIDVPVYGYDTTIKQV